MNGTTEPQGENLAIDGFSVDNEKLLYNGEPVGDGESRPGFQQYSFETKALGVGGNGVTFRVQHRVLEVDQVVKLYFPGNEGVASKAKLESIKNADPRIRDVIAQVHDAGTYRYPDEISYSVMESVSGIQTLKEWLHERDSQWAFAQASVDSDHKIENAEALVWKSRRSRMVMAEALNVAAGFIGAVARLHAAGVTHGDLNPGNILLLQESTDSVWSSFELQEFNARGRVFLDPKYDKFRSAHNRYLERTSNEARPGTLNQIPVKVIDLGSSQATGTNSQVGTARENWFVLDNLRKILKPLCGKPGSMMNWFRLEQVTSAQTTTTFVSPAASVLPAPRDLTSDVFRLICVMNILLGHLHNSRDPATDAPNKEFAFDHYDFADFNDLIGGELTGTRGDVFALDVLAVLRVLPQPRVESYVEWQAVIEHWGRMHLGFKKYTATQDDR
jgi:serine/threonine protein kinase